MKLYESNNIYSIGYNFPGIQTGSISRNRAEVQLQELSQSPKLDYSRVEGDLLLKFEILT
jgi:hypothetical protein